MSKVIDFNEKEAINQFWASYADLEDGGSVSAISIANKIPCGSSSKDVLIQRASSFIGGQETKGNMARSGRRTYNYDGGEHSWNLYSATERYKKMHKVLVIGSEMSVVRRMQGPRLEKLGIFMRWHWSSQGITTVAPKCEGVIIFRNLCHNVDIDRMKQICILKNIPCLVITSEIGKHLEEIKKAFPPRGDVSSLPAKAKPIACEEIKPIVEVPAPAPELEPLPVIENYKTPAVIDTIAMMTDAKDRVLKAKAKIETIKLNLEEAKKMVESYQEDLTKAGTEFKKANDEFTRILTDYARV